MRFLAVHRVHGVHGVDVQGVEGVCVEEEGIRKGMMMMMMMICVDICII